MTDSTDPAPRITDLSSIEPENFKFRNTQFLRADGHHYDNPHDESFLEQRKEIWRVRNGDLERVLEEFPTDRPLPEQCALWIHALVGKHFFPDANHRTAIVTLRKLLRDNGMEPENGRRSGSNGYGLSHTTFEERYLPSISTGCMKKTNCIASGFSSSARSFLKSIADYSSSSVSLSASASYSSSFSSTSFAISRSLSQFIVYRYLGVRTVKSVSLPRCSLVDVDRGVFSSLRRPTHRYSLLGFPMYSDFIVPFSR